MDNLNKIEIAARNKANYLKAKEAFNNKRVDECVRFYATDHEVKSKQSEKGRDGIQRLLEGLHQTWPDIQITVEHSIAEDNWVMGRSVATATHSQVAMLIFPSCFPSWPPSSRGILSPPPLALLYYFAQIHDRPYLNRSKSILEAWLL
jgi:predicted ester cyclase